MRDATEWARINGWRLLVIAGMVVTTVFALHRSSPSSDGFVFVFGWLLAAIVVSFPALVVVAFAAVAIAILVGVAHLLGFESPHR